MIDSTVTEGRNVKRVFEALIDQDKPAKAAAPAEAPSRAPAPAAAGSRNEDQRMSQMRKTIARRLSESKYSSPHFYLTADVDMERAVAFRKQINEVAEQQGQSKISFNDLITKASAIALRRHPAVNASYLDDDGVER